MSRRHTNKHGGFTVRVLLDLKALAESAYFAPLGQEGL